MKHNFQSQSHHIDIFKVQIWNEFCVGIMFYKLEKSIQYLLYMWLGGPQNWSGCGGAEYNTYPCQELKPACSAHGQSVYSLFYAHSDRKSNTLQHANSILFIQYFIQW